MNRIFFVIAIAAAFIPDAHPQTRTKRPNTQKQPAVRSSETTPAVAESSVTGRLTIEPSGAIWAGRVVLDANSWRDFAGTPTLTGFKIEQGRVKGKAEFKSGDNANTYTVTFDAPLKN